MKTVVKWTAAVVVLLLVVGFGAFLYFIPPFFVASPETFSKPEIDAAPPVADIADPGQRAIAARGRYLVVTGGCIGCHQIAGPQGPDYSKYLAGGLSFHTREGTYVTRNLTPDAETGLARRSDEEVLRVLRSGVMPDGRVTSYRLMPWGSYTNWTDEDRHAVLVYLRHLTPIAHRIPEPAPPAPLADPLALETVYGGKDYGTTPK
jgi:mono/diheme cytochrome c family protein